MKFNEVKEMLLEEELVLACESCHRKIMNALSRTDPSFKQEIIQKMPTKMEVINKAKSIAKTQRKDAKVIAMESYDILMALTNEEDFKLKRLFD